MRIYFICEIGSVWDEMFKATEIHRDAIRFEKQFIAMMVEQYSQAVEIPSRITRIEYGIANFLSGYSDLER
jgi:hypothetical protein